MAEKKKKRFVSNNAQLMAEWNWEKNAEFGFHPEKLTCSSGKKVWWKCKHGHEWQAIVANKAKGHGCPYCAGQKVVRGYNDLQTINPKLSEEWNYHKNNGLAPENMMANSSKKVWWKCNNGHEWQAKVANRNRGDGCPYCYGRYAIKGKSDLSTINPTLSKEWNYEKNGDLSPDNVTSNSNIKVWWKCAQGHEWKAAINNRNQGRNCPYCSGKKVLKGYNDLQAVNPIAANEWNYKKNGDLRPEDFTSNSNKKAWWICAKGHEWQTTIVHRNEGTGCPICHSERHTSLPEFAFLYYLKRYGLDVYHSYRDMGYELDIYIPSIKTAIEYDGYYWHKNKAEQDLEKNQKCKKDGIKLYRVREGLLPLNSTSIDYIVQRNQEDFAIILREVLSQIIGIVVDVDLERDAIQVENLRVYTEKDSSLLMLNPKLASEWNYEKNGNLKPENLFASSNKKVWWKCEKGHEWQATINHRNIGTGCPYCASKKVLSGYNDLSTINPTLSSEWNYEKNGDLRPDIFAASSNKKVWWRCEKGHEWQATIAHRNNGQGCPYCSGRKMLNGYNDLRTVNPYLASEWNYEKNGEHKPEHFTANSGEKAWWICQKGHEWQATIDSRNRGTGCPFCAGKKVLCGYNDLKTVNSSVANEWNYERNGTLKPEDVTANSHKKVWWKCSQGHEWETAIYNRNNTRGCPECNKTRRKNEKV